MVRRELVAVLWEDAWGSGNGSDVVDTAQLSNAKPHLMILSSGWLWEDSPKCIKLAQDFNEAGGIRNFLIIPRKYVRQVKRYKCRMEDA